MHSSINTREVHHNFNGRLQKVQEDVKVVVDR